MRKNFYILRKDFLCTYIAASIFAKWLYIIGSKLYSRSSYIILTIRFFFTEKIAVNFGSETRDNHGALSRKGEREERERRAVNGGKTESDEGGKKSCAATFECRENVFVGPLVYVHFARDAPPLHHKRHKNEQTLLMSLN